MELNLEEGNCFPLELECEKIKKVQKVVVFCSDPLHLGFSLYPSEELWKKIKRKKYVKMLDKEWIVVQEVDVASLTWFICKEKPSQKEQ